MRYLQQCGCTTLLTCSDGEDVSGLADNSVGGTNEGMWPPSDPSITEEHGTSVLTGLSEERMVYCRGCRDGGQ